MSLTAEIRTLLNYMTGGKGTIRQTALPAGAAITLTANGAGSTYGVWADVVAAPAVPTLVVGVFLSAPSAPDVFTVQIGSAFGLVNAAGVIAAGAPAVLAAGRAEVVVNYLQVTAVGVGIFSGFIPLTYPIYIAPANGTIIGRCYGITAAAVTIAARVACVTGY
jgi:hypothetical protein